MFAFLIIALSFFFAASVQAQMSVSAPAHPSTNISNTPQPATTSTPNSSQQPASNLQATHDIVLGRSYQDVQNNYLKIQQQRQQAQQQQIQSAQAQATSKTTAAIKRTAQQRSPALAPSTMSPQEYYWQQQLERQKLKAGIQTPESISELERKTYAGLAKKPTNTPAAKKSTAQAQAQPTSPTQSSVQQAVASATKINTTQRTKHRRKKKRNRRRQANTTSLQTISTAPAPANIAQMQATPTSQTNVQADPSLMPTAQPPTP